MDKVNKIIAIVLLVLFALITVGGSIWIQCVLWGKAWYLALSHLAVVGLAVEPSIKVVKWLLSFVVKPKIEEE